MPISFPCMLKEEPERHCLRKRGNGGGVRVDSSKGHRVRRPTCKFVHRKEENRQLEGYFHKLIILLRGSLRFHKQDLEHEKHINATNFQCFMRRDSGLALLVCRCFIRKVSTEDFGILLSWPFRFALVGGYWNRT